ncbi:MAG: RNA 2',3'-cyclic phosphodiesterase [Gammaproteobacteria bacterium]|jgi:2'-5' RNA ligase|nr:RNA 2',3'-cyclic phosphodiesterase [Gammaproteobacteria bacterium]|tara:strand:+ start:951 stop:1463 length:513 start_codon:yes stop_codon:yes gene_type:complete
MRLFFGLQLSQQSSLSIDHWRTTSLPPLTHPVPLVNFHITLTFLGNLDQRRLGQLAEAADEIVSQPFMLTLDELGFWNKPGILWLGCKEASPILLTLTTKTKHSANQLGFATEKRSYQPHVTLARRCESPPPAPIIPSGFTQEFQNFALYESVSTRSRVRYNIINEWSLG